MKPIAVAESSTIASARARTRAVRSSLARASAAESNVDAAKNPTTPHAHHWYRSGKVVTATSTIATSTSSARRPRSQCPGLLGTDVLRRDGRVALEEAAVVAWDVQPAVAVAQVVRVGGEPVGERDVGLPGFDVRATLLDAAVPRADVLADVAAVHLRAEMRTIFVRNRFARLRPVRQTAIRIERPGLVERVRRA